MDGGVRTHRRADRHAGRRLRWAQPLKHPRDPRAEPSIREAHVDIRFENGRRHSQRPRGEQHAAARKAAEAHHQLRVMGSENAPRDHDGPRGLRGRARESGERGPADRTARRGKNGWPARVTIDAATESAVPRKITRVAGACRRSAWATADARMRVSRRVADDEGEAQCASLLRTYPMHAAVIVLLVISVEVPRMQFHALALASDGITVDLIGEEGTPVPTRVLQHPRIRVSRLTPRRGWTGVIGSALALCLACRRLPRPDVIIAQTPPAIPTLVVTWVIARLRGSRLIIDWHNLGWTLLAVRFGADHPFVRVARWLERRRRRWRTPISQCLMRSRITCRRSGD